MFEAPDKRVWYFFVPVFLVAAVFLFSDSDSTLGRIVEPGLYVTAIILGGGLATLSIRDGYSLLHPSLSIDETPVLFWLEIGVGCIGFSAIGVWKLYLVVTHAV